MDQDSVKDQHEVQNEAQRTRLPAEPGPGPGSGSGSGPGPGSESESESEPGPGSGPESSCESFGSNESMDKHINFKGAPSTDPRTQLPAGPGSGSESESEPGPGPGSGPEPSCESFGSNESMDKHINFKGAPSTDPRSLEGVDGSSGAEPDSISTKAAAAPGEVPCDVCTGTKVKALKSCLDCVVSYCETHLEPHLTASGLRRHQLVEPVENLETRMCPKHSRPLEMFCQSDQTCLCMMCSVMEHKSHQLVPLREESEEKKVELEKTDADLHQMIQKRREKLEEIRESVRIRKDAADRGKAEAVEGFTALMELAQRGLEELKETMEEQQEASEREAEGWIKELEEEISELMERSSEVEQLSRSEDHLHLLQHFCSLKAPPATKDWTEVTVRPSSYEGTVLRAVAQLEDTLRDKMEEMKMKMMKMMMQQFAVDVTLDPLTAHPELVLSDDGKQVHCSDERKNLPDNKERFSKCVLVLGKQSFSSGRFYFEVQVKGKTKWDLGVAEESINRKGYITLSPKNGSWTVRLRDGDKYKACDDPLVILHLKCVPEKVGVFVDYEGGEVSFYDVDAAALIYSFTHCCFNNKLLPFFNPCLNDGGKNSAPLIICPVNQSD